MWNVFKAFITPPCVILVALGAIVAIDWVIDNHVWWLVGTVVLAVWAVWSFIEYEVNK